MLFLYGLASTILDLFNAAVHVVVAATAVGVVAFIGDHLVRVARRGMGWVDRVVFRIDCA